jgi:hypothetical protein
LSRTAGAQFAFACPPWEGSSAPSSGAGYTVWGTDIYTNDSSVCAAAVHAGLIDLEGGGEVVIEIRPGESSYLGTTANGVTTLSYGGWYLSFAFVDQTSGP